MILVFGAGGQLGLELVHQAKVRGIPIAGLTRSEADVAEPDVVAAAIARTRPTLVVNCAAYTNVDRAETDREAARRTNAVGAEVVAAAADAAAIPLAHISTDYVFDGAAPGARREEDPVRPLNVYGETKAEGETRVRAATRRHLILRTAWIFGVHGANFVKTIVARAAERDSLAIVADSRGSPTWSADVANAILAAHAAVAGGATPWGTYHVAGDGTASRYEQAVAIVRAQQPFTGRKPQVTPVASGAFQGLAPRPANSELDSSKFFSVFGTRPGPWQGAVDRVVRELLTDKPVA